MTITQLAAWRRSPPRLSRSPIEAVTEEGAGVYRARCSDCSAHVDGSDIDAAWMWLETHLCGTQTIHLR